MHLDLTHVACANFKQLSCFDPYQTPPPAPPPTHDHDGKQHLDSNQTDSSNSNAEPEGAITPSRSAMGWKGCSVVSLRSNQYYLPLLLRNLHLRHPPLPNATNSGGGGGGGYREGPSGPFLRYLLRSTHPQVLQGLNDLSHAIAEAAAGAPRDVSTQRVRKTTTFEASGASTNTTRHPFRRRLNASRRLLSPSYEEGKETSQWPIVVGLQVRMLRHKPSLAAFTERFVPAAVQASQEMRAHRANNTKSNRNNPEVTTQEAAAAAAAMKSSKVVLLVATLEPRAVAVILQGASKHSNVAVVLPPGRDHHQAFDPKHTTEAAVDMFGLAVRRPLGGWCWLLFFFLFLYATLICPWKSRVEGRGFAIAPLRVFSSRFLDLILFFTTL